jgi:uridine phosphorylase
MEWFSKGKSLINPKRFAAKIGFLKVGVVVFVERVYNWILNMAENVAIKREGGLVGTLRFFATSDGFGVFHSYFGAPPSVWLAEALIAGGVKKLVVFGEAGAIDPRLKIGQLLIPTFAIREEGTSYHYFPPNVSCKPSRILCGKLKALLNNVGFTYEEGGIWTTDAPLRETREKIIRCREKGAIAVDMECSALFAVSKYRKAHCAAILIITDELYGKRWKQGFENKKLIEKEKGVAETLTKNWRGLL